ncbi:MAG: methyltransferase domain-containing protein [Acidobacteria bacterium]|nr:methyltransferase domain-containing protein [Bacteroidota bacterium]MBS1766484.1 methyltransferase domain-containing protein [Acidobacteriota bacterium]
MTLPWNPAQYLKFAGSRTRAASELLARVPLEAPPAVVDLGCGPGNSTALLAARWPGARITGVDSSPEMLAAAREAMPGIAWIQGDVASWTPDAPVDLLFANAVLHWLPDHEALLPRLMGCLAPGGVLAVQMPMNGDSPAHRRLRELAGPAGDSGGWRPPLAPEAYYRILAPHASSVDVWETEYQQVMTGLDDIVEWAKGAALLPHLRGLGAEEAEALLARVREGLAGLYAPQPDGKVLFPFKRLFFVATRA